MWRIHEHSEGKNVVSSWSATVLYQPQNDGEGEIQGIHADVVGG